VTYISRIDPPPYKFRVGRAAISASMILFLTSSGLRAERVGAVTSAIRLGSGALLVVAFAWTIVVERVRRRKARRTGGALL